MINENVSYRDWMMNLIAKPVMSDEAKRLLEESVKDTKMERATHQDTYAGAYHSFFQEFVKYAEELVEFGFFKKIGDNRYMLTKEAFAAKI
ncbi:MAG: hypothetical protein WA139_02290 [Candidatus Aenigmatarchaeota archaeon]